MNGTSHSWLHSAQTALCISFSYIRYFNSSVFQCKKLVLARIFEIIWSFLLNLCPCKEDSRFTLYCTHVYDLKPHLFPNIERALKGMKSLRFLTCRRQRDKTGQSLLVHFELRVRPNRLRKKSMPIMAANETATL